jgi:hypothetical protein
MSRTSLRKVIHTGTAPSPAATTTTPTAVNRSRHRLIFCKNTSRTEQFSFPMKGASQSVLRGLDLTIKTEADRDKALAILRNVGQGDEPLSAASVEALPVFLGFMRRLPLVPVELVPDLIGASFELARKINEAHPGLLAKKHPRETIAALSQVFLFMPPGSKWVVCTMLAQLLVGCGPAAADEMLAMLLDAGGVALLFAVV